MKEQHKKDIIKRLAEIKIVQLDNKRHEDMLLARILKQKGNIRQHNIIKIAFTFIPALAAAIILFFLLFNPIRQYDKAEITQKSGILYYLDDENNEQIFTGEIISEGITLITGKEAFLEVKLEKNAIIQIGEYSKLNFVQLNSREKNKADTLKLIEGNLHCEFDLLEEDLSPQIQTDILSVSMVGTAFDIQVTAQGLHSVSVSSGVVNCSIFPLLRQRIQVEFALDQQAMQKIDSIFSFYVKKINQGEKREFDEQSVRQLNNHIFSLAKKRTDDKQDVYQSLSVVLKEIDIDNFLNNPPVEEQTEKTPLKQEIIETTEEKQEDFVTEESPLLIGSEDFIADEMFDLTLSETAQQKEKSTLAILDINGSVEKGAWQPDAWKFSQTHMAFIWSRDTFYKGKRSLQIQLAQPFKEKLAWIHTEENIQPEEFIRLEAYIKCKNITGNGVNLAIKAETQSGITLEVDSRENIAITGNHSWEKYNLQLPVEAANKIKSISIFLEMLNNTTGSVYFDEIKLSYR